MADDNRVRFQVDPEIFAKAQKKTGLSEKSDVFEALLKGYGNGTETEAMPDSLRNLDPQVVQAMVQEQAKANKTREFWNDVLLEAKARKARADAIKSELEIQNLKVDPKTKYTYRGTPLWCFTHHTYEAPDSKCFAGFSEADRRVLEK